MNSFELELQGDDRCEWTCGAAFTPCFLCFVPTPDLIHCTNELNVSIPQLADTLLERTASNSWIVVFKALITTHHLMMYGNEVSTRATLVPIGFCMRPCCINTNISYCISFFTPPLLSFSNLACCLTTIMSHCVS